MARITPQDDLYEVVEKNLELSEKTFAAVEKIRKHLFWQQVKGWIKAVIAIAALVAAAFAVPYYIKRVQDQYAPMLKQLPPELQNYLKQK